jgi:hypothetical protein
VDPIPYGEAQKVAGKTVEEMKGNGYRGRSKATLELLEACKKIIEETQPITVRGVCYRLFVAGLIDSMAVKNTQKISRLLTWAREEGKIDWGAIVDESRTMEGWAQYADLQEYGEYVARQYSRDFWSDQPNSPILISEKATVSGILRPVLSIYGVPFFAVHGFNSATKMHDLADDIAGDERHTVLLYVGDYDPSGLYMSERDLPSRLKQYGAKNRDYTLRRVALKRADTRSLPSFPASDKAKDPRYGWFVENYGRSAWELDAMNPNELRSRVESEIKRYVNPDDWQRHRLMEALQRETTRSIAQAIGEAGAK